MPETRDTNRRNAALDGLRGIAALIVVLWHLAVCFFPAAAWGVEQPTSLPWERHFYESPLWVAVSGSFAVGLFFVLSGYVLTVGYFRSRTTKPLIQRIVGRPIRLGVLAGVSTIVLWCGLRGTPNAGAELLVPALTTTNAFAAVAPHLNLQQDESVHALLANIFWLPWFQPSEPKAMYNGVLWTMHVELFGSILAMALAPVLSLTKSSWMISLSYMTIGVAMAIAIPDSGIYFAIFLCGSALAALDPQVLKADYCKRVAAICLAAVGLLLGGLNDPALALGPAPVGAVFSYGNVVAMGIGSVAFLYAVLISSDLSKILSVPALVFAGRISFSLYVFHPIVIFGVGLNVFLSLGFVSSIEIRSIVAATASLVACLGIAIISTAWIDGPTIKLARTFSRLVWK